MLLITAAVVFILRRRIADENEVTKDFAMPDLETTSAVPAADVLGGATQSFQSTTSTEPQPAPAEATVVNQWTDENGYTWRAMSDGTNQWWTVVPNGNRSEQRGKNRGIFTEKSPLGPWSCLEHLSERCRWLSDQRAPVGEGPVVVLAEVALPCSRKPRGWRGSLDGHHHGRPLLIYHGLDERYPHASLRHHNAVLDAVVDLHHGFKNKDSATCFTSLVRVIARRP